MTSINKQPPPFTRYNRRAKDLQVAIQKQREQIERICLAFAEGPVGSREVYARELAAVLARLTELLHERVRLPKEPAE